jgi:hypothetical protein
LHPPTNPDMETPTLESDPQDALESTPSARASRRSWRPNLATLGFELLIVFIGVLSAFTVENQRERGVEEREARLIFSGLRREMEGMTGYLQIVDSILTADLRAFDSAYARGERPLPYVFRHDASERPYSGAWQAAMNAEGVNYLDTELLFNLTSYYEEQLGVADRYVRYATFTESEVLPYISEGPDHFYEPGTARLKPLYRAHIERLRELHGWWAGGARGGMKLIERLDAALAH